MVPCAMCGTETWKPDAWLKRTAEAFCSSRCNGVRRAEELVKHSHKGKAGWTDASRASYREKMTGPNNPAWKGGVTVFKKHGNYAGVRYVRAPEWARPMARKDGYIMEHRLQMAVLCGYLLTRQEVINHENHDPKDNRPENLTLWPSNRAHKLYEGGKMEEGLIRWSDETQQKTVELIRLRTRDAVKTFLDIDYMEKIIARVEGKAAKEIEDAVAKELAAKEARAKEKKPE